MVDHIYKKIELVGSSKNSIEEAINNAINTASKTLNNLDWFEVVETRGNIQDGHVEFFQVTIRVGFRLTA